MPTRETHLIPNSEYDLFDRTHFERRMRPHDEAVYRSEFRKSTG